MTSLTVNLKIIKKSQDIIYMPSHMAKSLGLTPNQTIPVYFGLGGASRALIKTLKINKNELYISSQLKDQLLVPYSKNVYLKKEEDGLRLGPIIGILTTDYTGRKFSNIKKNSNAFNIFFRDLLSPEPSYPAYYFVFTPENVDWTTKSIKGHFYSNNIWKTVSVPFPDVIYNRLPNRTIENKPEMEAFKNQYSMIGGRLFNSDFYNKWDIYDILRNEEKTKRYIPETYLSPSIENLIDMVKKHSIIYLKPANGSLGLGIYKIVKTKSGFLVQYRGKSQNKSIIFKDLTSLYKYIFTTKYRHRYVIQQGINLVDYLGSPVDFRVQLHKNHLNKWQVIAIGAKVAGKGSVTTHLRTGGKLIHSTQFLNKVFGTSSERVQEHIKRASIEIAKAIEGSKKSPIGELGLDVGVDKNQQVWLFEANSKPGRSIFKHPSLNHARHEANKRLIEYGIYLSDFIQSQRASKEG